MPLGTAELVVDHARPFVEVRFPAADRRALAWLDTGGGAFIVGRALARDLSVEPERREVDGREMDLLDLPSVEIGGARLDTTGAIAARRDGDLVTEGFDAEAFVPAHVLRRHDVVFDYRDRQFSIDAATEPVGQRVDARSHPRPGWPVVTVTIAGEEVNLLLDTGASCCMFSDALIARLEPKISARRQGAYGLANMSAGPWEASVETIRVPDFAWGPVAARSVVAVSRPRGNFEEMISSGTPVPVEGALAGNILQHLRLEWRHAEQAAWIDAPTLDDETLSQVPLTLHAVDGAMRVVGLADEATAMGFQIGDDILSVDGQTTQDLTFGRVVEMISGEAGKRFEVRLRRAGEATRVDAEAIDVV